MPSRDVLPPRDPPPKDGGGSIERGTSISVVRDELLRLAWPHKVTCLSVTADGSRLLSGSDVPQPRVRLYDLNSGKLTQSFLGPQAAIRAVALAGNGERVLAVADSAVYVW